MSRPIAPIVHTRLADRFRKNGHSIADSVIMATQAIKFIESAGLDIVMPGWVPIVDEDVVLRRPRVFAWEDIPALVAELEDRAPWRPYEKKDAV